MQSYVWVKNFKLKTKKWLRDLKKKIFFCFWRDIYIDYLLLITFIRCPSPFPTKKKDATFNHECTIVMDVMMRRTDTSDHGLTYFKTILDSREYFFLTGFFLFRDISLEFARYVKIAVVVYLELEKYSSVITRRWRLVFFISNKNFEKQSLVVSFLSCNGWLSTHQRTWTMTVFVLKIKK